MVDESPSEVKFPSKSSRLCFKPFLVCLAEVRAQALFHTCASSLVVCKSTESCEGSTTNAFFRDMTGCEGSIAGSGTVETAPP